MTRKRLAALVLAAVAALVLTGTLFLRTPAPVGASALTPTGAGTPTGQATVTTAAAVTMTASETVAATTTSTEALPPGSTTTTGPAPATTSPRSSGSSTSPTTTHATTTTTTSTSPTTTHATTTTTTIPVTVTLTGCQAFNGGAGTKVLFKITGSNSVMYKVTVTAGGMTDTGMYYGAQNTGNTFPTVAYAGPGSCSVRLGG